MTSPEDIHLNTSELDRFFTKYFSYYGTLDVAYRQVFIARCLEFISNKTISGGGDFKPDNRVKALIAASAVQLTLGLETWQLDYFEAIEIHASDFLNATGNTRFNGETNLQGYIKLSWKSFIKGYSINDDNVNLGLHEFSHALRFNNIRGDGQDYFVDHYFNKWLACAYEAFYDIRNKEETIFREYGGSNMNEFLSVCIEHYFESPGEIKERYPLLFYATGILLNQHTHANRTRIGIRREFLLEMNKLLPGFAPGSMQSRFIQHWTFKLFLFVSAVFIYNLSTQGITNPISLLLFLLSVSACLWYDYTALKLCFDASEIHFEKGAGVFKKRKSWEIPVSHLISLQINNEDWEFRYYSDTDNFFHEATLTGSKELNELFLRECRQNKIALPGVKKQPGP